MALGLLSSERASPRSQGVANRLARPNQHNSPLEKQTRSLPRKVGPIPARAAIILMPNNIANFSRSNSTRLYPLGRRRRRRPIRLIASSASPIRFNSARLCVVRPVRWAASRRRWRCSCVGAAAAACASRAHSGFVGGGGECWREEAG